MQSSTRKSFVRLLPALLLVSAMIGQAQTPTPQLLDWEQLSADQRNQLTAPTRDRWNAASPEQRARMFARAERWQQMEPAERSRISGAIGRWQNLPPGQHHELRALFHHLRGLGETERDTFLTHWKSMSTEQRASWVEANPAPAREGPSRHRRAHTGSTPTNTPQ